MLVAKTEKGRIISLLTNKDRSTLLEICQRENLYCPVCHGKVQIRMGQKRIWHFSHLSKSRCDWEYERESAYHRQGKIKLYRWFEKQQITVEMEKYLEHLKQRPDLLVTWNRQKYAIEYQCSSIDTTLLIKRTNTYLRENIIPIWIVGGNRLKRFSKHEIKLTAFDTLMTYSKQNQGFYLLYYCSSTDRFCITSPLLPFTSTKCMTTTTYIPSNQWTFPKMISANNRKLVIHLQTWLDLKKRWRTHNQLYARPYDHQFFYQYGIPLSLLPGEAGIPLKSLMWIKTDAFLWQSWILMKFIMPLSIGDTISFHDIFHQFKKEVHTGHFMIRKLPSIKNSHYSFAIMEYLQQLQTFGILRQTYNHTVYQKIGEMKVPKNIEEAFKLDRQFLKKLRASSLYVFYEDNIEN